MSAKIIENMVKEFNEKIHQIAEERESVIQAIATECKMPLYMVDNSLDIADILTDDYYAVASIDTETVKEYLKEKHKLMK